MAGAEIRNACAHCTNAPVEVASTALLAEDWWVGGRSTVPRLSLADAPRPGLALVLPTKRMHIHSQRRESRGVDSRESLFRVLARPMMPELWSWRAERWPSPQAT